MPEKPLLSIVIPVLNETDCLDQSLTRLFAIEHLSDECEVIISDGGSTDDSVAIARQHGCRIVNAERGRASQMNSASLQARGSYLLFLHADSHLPEDFLNDFREKPLWGFFQLRLNGKAGAFRLIETAINIRTRASRVAGGDQGLFFDAGFFTDLGGYPKIPLMEDIAICKLAKRQAPPRIIKSRIISSSRRWQENGIVKTVLLMWWLRFAYWIGVSPGRLHRSYYPQSGS